MHITPASAGLRMWMASSLRGETSGLSGPEFSSGTALAATQRGTFAAGCQHGLVQTWGCQCVSDIFAPVVRPGGRGVRWILKLAVAGDEGACVEVMEVSKPDDLSDIANLGLTLTEAKQLLARVQREISTAQARAHAVGRPVCPCGDGVCRVKDYRDHAVATLFGQVTLRVPRFRCGACGRIETGINWPSHCRSTPELDRLRAHLSALMTYRVSADLLEHMFPVDAGFDPRTLRRHTMKAGVTLADRAAIRPPAAAPAITITVDSTFVRSREDGESRFEVRVGNVETKAKGRQVFGSVAKAGTNIEELIRKNLDAVGGTSGTALTAFTDGCPGLRGILADAGVLEPPILDWFHIAMRLQLSNKSAMAWRRVIRRATQPQKAVIVAEVERLHWRIWNGKAKNCAEEHRSYPRSDAASFPGRAGQAGTSGTRRRESFGRPYAGTGQVFDWPERVGWSTMR